MLSDEEDDRFFESFDRIPSTSGSDTEEDFDHLSSSFKKSNKPLHLRNGVSSALVASRFEIWQSEPCSVEERRQRLLQQFGLNSRPNGEIASPNVSSGENASVAGTSLGNDMYRSASYDELSRKSGKSPASASWSISRSQSDGASSSSTVNKAIRDSSYVIQSNGVTIQTNVDTSSSVSRSLQSNSVVAKPPSGREAQSNCTGNDGRPLGDLKLEPRNCVAVGGAPNVGGRIDRESSSNSDSSYSYKSSESGTDLSRLSGNEADRSGDSIGDCSEEPLCLIKNLDTGKEFVVKEVREDGMWNKLRDMETGKQLTMEEFQRVLGHSPLVQELMRRERVEQAEEKDDGALNGGGSLKGKKKGSWLKSMKGVADTFLGSREKRSSDEKDSSSEKGRRSSSTTDDNQEVLMHTPQWTRVHQYGKTGKEFTALYMGQEISAHQGSIWAIKFSIDGRYLATAGQDRVINVWKVTESERMHGTSNDKSEDGLTTTYVTSNGTSDLLALHIDSLPDKKKKGKLAGGRKSTNLESIMLPENLFLLSEKPHCSFHGHTDDVLDLSWSKSRLLLSSSMDKTVRLWHLLSNTCLRIFSHNDFVTCIQFNPVDDRFFISGSLDKKVRIWSIPDRKVVDWTDLHEMVTAACYTPDGQTAYVGTNKGNCYLYNTSGNKLQEEKQINVQNKKKKSRGKKITGFQFAPGNRQKVLITSADSRIRVFDGSELIKKYKGFRNTNSQICASFTENGKYVICASENSSVYIWNYDCPNTPAAKNQGISRAYEYFTSRNVYTAIPWHGLKPEHNLLLQDELLLRGMITSGRKSSSFPMTGRSQDHDSKLCGSSFDKNGEMVYRGNARKENVVSEIVSPQSFLMVKDRHSFSGFNRIDAPTAVESLSASLLESATLTSLSLRPLHQPSSTHGIFPESLSRGAATWPEEKLPSFGAQVPAVSHVSQYDEDGSITEDQSPAWGLVIVTAGHDGQVRTFQNYGWPFPSR
eukprot:TRINITY_DN16480_c0_g1_i2.p1 TRINITY_DN16480_c0_g1~~TRINITY_DN16480_c0_g1_i2.p1  ORF type:complete len:983 (+),score=173.51 TRINITY_DN16480_c0_g1_i2:356-3304(+)